MKWLFSCLILMVGLNAFCQDSYTCVKQRIIKWSDKDDKWKGATEWVKTNVELEFDGHYLTIYDKQTLQYNLKKVVDNKKGILSWEAVDLNRKSCFVRVTFNQDGRHDLFISYELENWGYHFVITSE